MPIYEFRCLDCRHIFELLALSKGEQIEAMCPKCGCESFERVLSRSNYTMGGGRSRAGSSGASVNNHSCAGGSCATIDIPGPSK
ncbi:MAG: zinc ribbon domain-containing protein [Thermodesulfobacteriota bacterium]